MRCFPRKSRSTWVFFLLTVCMLGVYLAYRRLLDSEKGSSRNYPTQPRQTFDEMQEELKQKVRNDLMTGKKKVGSKFTDTDSIDLAGPIADQKPDIVGGVAAGRVLDNEEDYISPEEKLGRLKLLLLQLSPTNWKTTADPDEIILLTKSEFMDLGIDSKMSCREIDFLKSNTARNGYHGKKYVDFMKQDNTHEFVLKSVGNDHQLKIECMKQDYNAERCNLMGNYKLLKEIVLLLTLNYPGLIKVQGFCLRGDTIDHKISQRGVILATESGKPVQQEMISLMRWKDRMEVSRTLAFF